MTMITTNEFPYVPLLDTEDDKSHKSNNNSGGDNFAVHCETQHDPLQELDCERHGGCSSLNPCLDMELPPEKSSGPSNITLEQPVGHDGKSSEYNLGCEGTISSSQAPVPSSAPAPIPTPPPVAASVSWKTSINKTVLSTCIAEHEKFEEMQRAIDNAYWHGIEQDHWEDSKQSLFGLDLHLRQQSVSSGHSEREQ
ncbi:hypothetical protein BGX34_000089 [Mortierella sp. NVP85]|nr:hypothetical protein BGX34_000089 [Mortierella sp. NVP85]